MSNNTIKSILIDTNILVDFYITNRENHKNAVNVFNQLVNNHIEMFVAYHSLLDFIYLEKSYIKNVTNFSSKYVEKKIVKSLENVLDFLTVVEADHFDVKFGIKSFKRHQDFEDNLVIAAAERAKVNYVLTNDNEMLKHYPKVAINYNNMLSKM